MSSGILKGKSETPKLVENDKSDLYKTSVKGLDRIEKEGVDRVILSVTEIGPQDNVARFIDAEEINYYPFGLLLKDEQRMMLEGKHYQVIALVTEEVMGQKRNKTRGVEVYNRTHFHPFLPYLDKTSNLKYISKGGVYTEENGLANLCQELDWTPELFEKGLLQGINWYNDQTRALMKNHTELQENLKQIQERDCSPIEQILKEVRKVIQAKR